MEYKNMVQIPKGTYTIGTNSNIGFKDDHEEPRTEVTLDSFYIDETTVTNKEFSRFIEDTEYVTEAEEFGWSFVFHYFVSEEEKKQAQAVQGLNWWLAIQGANWKHPEGKDSNINDRMDHPVVHVSRNDALAYRKWANKRLPTEAAWEVAAKGGTDFDKFPWGEDFLIDGKYNANIWQGNFPLDNTLEDGFSNTAPAKYFKPNDYGVYQTIGNVWEWCLNPRGIPLSDFQTNNSQFYYEKYDSKDDEQYAIKGGSFLCHDSYCNRYRLAARNGNTGQSSSNNMGFRCVKDIE